MQDWIPDLVWLEIVALSAMDSLRDLPDSVVRNDAAWHTWYDNEAPERAVIPDFQTRISKFARMCVVKVRPWSSTAGAVTCMHACKGSDSRRTSGICCLCTAALLQICPCQMQLVIMVEPGHL